VTLHIYAQADNHREAWIVGHPDSLRRLAGAIQAALDAADGCASCLQFAADCEGYATIVMARDPDGLALPYTDPVVEFEGAHPLSLLGRGRYRELARPERDGAE
jgi:hypothetical protein